MFGLKKIVGFGAIALLSTGIVAVQAGASYNDYDYGFDDCSWSLSIADQNPARVYSIVYDTNNGCTVLDADVLWRNAITNQNMTGYCPGLNAQSYQCIVKGDVEKWPILRAGRGDVRSSETGRTQYSGWKWW